MVQRKSLAERPLRIFIVAGEHSGDQLGFKLMRSLRQATDGKLVFEGVGGALMINEGLVSLFPMADIAVMGLSAVLARLRRIFKRIAETVDALVAMRPDVLVIIDSSGFTHRVARRARRRLPTLRVVNYVSPSVWAWRPGRARRMRAYVDHLLALLPFEPAVHQKLGGPTCTYVGHPLLDRLSELRPGPDEAWRRDAKPPVVLILPGSRHSEISRLMRDFGAVAARLSEKIRPIDFVLPAVSHLVDEIERAIADWPVKPRILTGEAAKWQSFRTARAALAASGTVTLELALAGVPMVVAYKVSKLEEQLKYIVKVPSIVLPNLILGENAVPEFLQRACTPDRLAGAMLPLIEGGRERDAQLIAFTRLDALMRLPDETSESSDLAARIVLEIAR
jgi:lipid-A-disaccharide synthase